MAWPCKPAASCCMTVMFTQCRHTLDMPVARPGPQPKWQQYNPRPFLVAGVAAHLQSLPVPLPLQEGILVLLIPGLPLASTACL